jgi:restriction system protein
MRVGSPALYGQPAMPIPEFNEIKAPALKFFFTEAKPHKISELYTVLGKHFNLTEGELSEVLPSGKQRRWHNRVNWACYDLFRAGLLDRPNRGVYVVTDWVRRLPNKSRRLLTAIF